MFTILKDAEVKLCEMAQAIRYEAGPYFALHFHFSLLEIENSSEYQIKIAINVINDLFKNKDGGIFLCEDGDVIIIYQGEDKILIDKTIFQLRYFFADDKLAFIKDGVENPNFNSVFLLKYQWQDFFELCLKKRNYDPSINSPALTTVVNKNEADKQSLDITKLIYDINQVAFRPLLRWQDICFVSNDNKEVKILYQEVYVSISHLREQLDDYYQPFNNKKLFLYITEKLDLIILKLLHQQALMPNNTTMSLNLNVATILSGEFLEFDRYIKANKNLSMVVEIDIVDVFSDISAFNAAKNLLHSLHYRICLDGVNNFSFMQIDRETLGFDLVKVQWNLDDVASLTNEENSNLIEAIKKCGANRIILARCDNQNAISYGHALGISLFQGWHLDKLVNHKI